MSERSRERGDVDTSNRRFSRTQIERRCHHERQKDDSDSERQPGPYPGSGSAPALDPVKITSSRRRDRLTPSCETGLSIHNVRSQTTAQSAGEKNAAPRLFLSMRIVAQ